MFAGDKIGWRFAQQEVCHSKKSGTARSLTHKKPEKSLVHNKMSWSNDHATAP
jgi:hypothetical protein